MAAEPEGRGVLIVASEGDVAAAIGRAFVGAGWLAVLATAGEAATSGSLDAAIEWLGGDPESPEGAAALVAAAGERLGRVDALVVQAGSRYRGPALDATPGDWRGDLDRILYRAFFLSQAFARPTGGGQRAIVYLATIDAAHSYPGRVTASVAMPGLEGLARALAVEWAEAAIRVNVVAHGIVLTHEERARIDRGDASLDRVFLRSPMHRLPSLEEIASAVVFVASPRASFMTGQTLDRKSVV